MFMVAISLVMLMGAAAIAVDLSAMRADRSTDQKVTDSAAAAGALAVLEDDGAGQEGCEAAIAYVSINAEEIGTLDASGCAAEFSADCTPDESHTVESGRFTITVTYPVANTDPLMTSGALGAPTQGVVADDGDPCERVGVAMSAVHTGLFAKAIGFDQGTTSVHSVARAFLPPPDGPPLNLVVLDRFECQGVRVEGNGGVIVNAVEDPDGKLFEGLLAADSSGESGIDCVDEEGETAGVIHIKGSGPPPLVRADGPTGCPEDDPLTPMGEGCGLIQVFAPGTPGCNFPACTAGAGGSNPPIPLPTALPERLTRAQIDYTYNCWDDYTWITSMPGGVSWATEPLNSANQQSIPKCTEGTSAHVYGLLASVGANGRAGHTAWNADLSHPCNVTSGQVVTEPSSDIWVDCDDFIVEGDVTINGNVIFQGNVHVKSDGKLEIDNTDGWVVFRGNSPTGTGEFKKDGQASLIFEQTAVYLSKTSWVDIAGGSTGTLSWNAPTSDTSNFKDLALWSDSPSTHFWAGQGNLDMSGAFFTPLAKVDYAGSSGQNQTEAQWIADKLVARGQGQLVIQPKFSHPFKRDPTPQTMLLR